MAASSTPALPLREGRLELGGSYTVLAVDPSRELLDDLVGAWVAAVPGIADPNVDQLREEFATENGSVADSELFHVDGIDSTPTLRVAARKPILDEAFDGFHPASRAAALVDADRLTLTEIVGREPSPLVLTPHRSGAVLTTSSGHLAVMDTGGTGLRERYVDHLDGADTYDLRTPSRRALFRAFADRCGPEFAADLLACLDRDPSVARGDPCDHLERTYAVAARHRALNYEVRRASEDCGLASPSTLSNVKADLEDASLVDTESVPRPVGRPRQRVVPADDLLTTVQPEEVPDVVAAAMSADGDGDDANTDVANTDVADADDADDARVDHSDSDH